VNAYKRKHAKLVNKISVIGLGKLGAPLAACLASKGFDVIGVDVDKNRLGTINKGVSPVFEPGLDELLKLCRTTLSTTENYEEAFWKSDATFLLVPTPSDESGGFSLTYVIQACERIGAVLREKEDYHLVVLTSTVLPGATENEVLPVLEASSGKRCGVDFGLCYSPEFVSLGNVIKDLFRPDFILIGESDPRAGDTLARIYRRFCENQPPVVRMNFVNAELTKLSVNTFVTTKIAFANMLARMCERLPGADVDIVTGALGMDSRIGRKYLKGAVGYGGPCFPRDNLALACLGRRLGSGANLAEATDSSNRQEVKQLVELVKSKLPKNGVVGILGLAYKPNTDVVEESQGLLLAQGLISDGIPVRAYDPAGIDNARRILSHTATFSASVGECLSSDVVVIATPWDEFKHIPREALGDQKNPRRVLIDCWRLLNAAAYQSIVDYIPMGVGPRD
jgi:UDPglucose 6-dehydrogenase